MAGKVEIINIALARLGESPIQSLEEGSVSANAAKQLFDAARLATLRDYNWAFALRLAPLARLEEVPSDFHCAYALPSECVKAIRLRGEAPFVVRGDRLYTDAGSAVLEYVADESDAALLDAKFTEALSYKLASDLAMPVKGSVDLMSYYRDVYSTYIRQAAAHSVGENRANLSENPYLEARY